MALHPSEGILLNDHLGELDKLLLDLKNGELRKRIKHLFYFVSCFLLKNLVIYEEEDQTLILLYLLPPCKNFVHNMLYSRDTPFKDIKSTLYFKELRQKMPISGAQAEGL